MDAQDTDIGTTAPIVAAADAAIGEIDRLLARAHVARYAARASQDTEDGEAALEMIYDSGTRMRYYAAQARQLREGYERYVRRECPKAG